MVNYVLVVIVIIKHYNCSCVMVNDGGHFGSWHSLTAASFAKRFAYMEPTNQQNNQPHSQPTNQPTDQAVTKIHTKVSPKLLKRAGLCKMS